MDSNKIVVLVPTYKRAEKLPAFVSAFRENSSISKLFFICVGTDTESHKVLDELGQEFVSDDGEYVAAINRGFKATTEPFVVCASDDVVFTPGWDVKIMEVVDKNPDKHIFGGIDGWKVSMTQKHISHPLVRRSHYAERNPEGNLYYPGYIHYMCDVEFIQRGWVENCVMVTPQIFIDHPHTVSEDLVQAQWDETYKRSFAKISFDEDLYNRRKGEFEVWNFKDLAEGRVVPTKLNPLYNKTLLTIVIPSYRDYEYLTETLKSVVNNTYYRFELIIINDGPDGEMLDPWTIVNRKTFLNSIQLQDKSCTIKVVHNDKQKWVNHNWNLGAEMATGDYVAFLNSDIQLSEDWDKYLISALENPSHKFTVACPYETNPHHKKAFPLDKAFMKYCPNMIKGQCFLLRKSDVPQIFPIPKQIKHWCGDNWIADRSEAMNKTVFARMAVVYHHISKSSNTVKSSVFQERTYKDILWYEKLTGKSLSFIKHTFPDVIRNYCSVDEDES